jgi:hypothetical protein
MLRAEDLKAASSEAPSTIGSASHERMSPFRVVVERDKSRRRQLVEKVVFQLSIEDEETTWKTRAQEVATGRRRRIG